MSGDRKYEDILHPGGKKADSEPLEMRWAAPGKV
jgi:hypothetical protein